MTLRQPVPFGVIVKSPLVSVVDIVLPLTLILSIHKLAPQIKVSTVRVPLVQIKLSLSPRYISALLLSPYH